MKGLENLQLELIKFYCFGKRVLRALFNLLWEKSKPDSVLDYNLSKFGILSNFPPHRRVPSIFGVSLISQTSNALSHRSEVAAGRITTFHFCSSLLLSNLVNSRFVLDPV